LAFYADQQGGKMTRSSLLFETEKTSKGKCTRQSRSVNLVYSDRGGMSRFKSSFKGNQSEPKGFKSQAAVPTIEPGRGSQGGIFTCTKGRGILFQRHRKERTVLPWKKWQSEKAQQGSNKDQGAQDQEKEKPAEKNDRTFFENATKPGPGDYARFRLRWRSGLKRTNRKVKVQKE